MVKTELACIKINYYTFTRSCDHCFTAYFMLLWWCIARIIHSPFLISTPYTISVHTRSNNVTAVIHGMLWHHIQHNFYSLINYPVFFFVPSPLCLSILVTRQLRYDPPHSSRQIQLTPASGQHCLPPIASASNSQRRMSGGPEINFEYNIYIH